MDLSLHLPTVTRVERDGEPVFRVNMPGQSPIECAEEEFLVLRRLLNIAIDRALYDFSALKRTRGTTISARDRAVLTIEYNDEPSDTTLDSLTTLHKIILGKDTPLICKHYPGAPSDSFMTVINGRFLQLHTLAEVMRQRSWLDEKWRDNWDDRVLDSPFNGSQEYDTWNTRLNECHNQIASIEVKLI